MKFGDDKVISMGGSLPTEVANGLPAIYTALCKSEGPWLAVVTLTTDYVKVYSAGLKPDEPVIKLTRIEVASGDDAATLLDMLDRLNAARQGVLTLAGTQDTLDAE